MKVGVLAWGSLYYNIRELKIKDNQWHSDGPVLPIEFSMISVLRTKLTLLIYPCFDKVRTYYGVSKFDTLQEARGNLATNEGARNSNNIGFINFKTEEIKGNKMQTKYRTPKTKNIY